MKRINKYILSAMLLGCGTMVTTSCNDFLTEKPESMIGPDNIGDSKEAVDTWVTGVNFRSRLAVWYSGCR